MSALHPCYAHPFSGCSPGQRARQSPLTQPPRSTCFHRDPHHRPANTGSTASAAPSAGPQTPALPPPPSSPRAPYPPRCPFPELTNCGRIVAAVVNVSDLPRSANLDIAHLCGSRGEGEPAYTRHFTNPTPSSALSTPPLPTWRRRNGNSTSSSPTCPCRPTPPATRSLRSGPVSVVTGVLL